MAGVGLFQVPAGVVDLRWGSRRTALAGLVVMGVAGVASAVSTRILDLVALRFLAGAGAAFFFSPALSLVSSYFPPGQRGPVIGLFNGGFSLGGAVGVAVGAAIGLRFGWPWALEIGGIALLALVAFNWVVLPKEPRTPSPDRPRLFEVVRKVVLSKSIWALSLALSGFWAAMFLVAQDYVYYAATTHPAWGTETAAIIATMFIVMSFPGGPLGGWIGERGWDRRHILVVFAAADGLLVLSIPFLGLYPSAAVFLLMGLFDGVVFAVLYLIPSYLPESQGWGLALGVAVVNSIQVLIGSALAVAFGYVAVSAGFTVAWIFAGLLTLGLIPALGFVSPNRATSSPVPSASKGSAMARRD